MTHSRALGAALGAVLLVASMATARTQAPAAGIPACGLTVGAIVAIDPSTYGLVLDSDARGPVAVHVEFFSDTDDFALNIDGVTFDPPDTQPAPAAGTTSPLRSAPYFVRLPKAADLLAARVQRVDAAGAPVATCSAQYAFTDFFQSQAPSSVGPSAEARALRQSLRHAFLAGPPTLSAIATIARPSQHATCPERYRMARVVAPASVEYPAAARGTTGLAIIAVALDTTGAVADVRVYQSSRSKELDNAALDAARHSRYAPAVFRCEPVAGAYLFRAEFNGAARPVF